MAPGHFSVKEHTVPCQHIRHYARGTLNSQEAQLYLAVKQYCPRYDRDPQPGDITIIGCHASGFPKELYEPIWDHLFQQSLSQGFRIRNIWTADIANQGASGVLNETEIGTEPSYFDHARDLLLMVNHFRAEMVRPIAAFGHSLGGCVALNLALLHPRLLMTTIVIEPVINATAEEMNLQGVYAIVHKSDLWPSRAAAETEVRKNPLFKSWNPAVMELYTQYAFQNTPTVLHLTPDLVTTKTTKHQAAFSYALPAFPRSANSTLQHSNHQDSFPSSQSQNNTNAFCSPASPLTFAQLPHLLPSCYYIYGADSPMAGTTAQARDTKLKITGTATDGSGGVAMGRVAELVVPNTAHFVAFEKPALIGQVSAKWLKKELALWKQKEDEENEARRREKDKTGGKVAVMSEEYLWWVDEQYGPTEKKPQKPSRSHL